MPANQSAVAGDPERLVCPNDHLTWERTADRFWRYDCSQQPDPDREPTAESAESSPRRRSGRNR